MATADGAEDYGSDVESLVNMFGGVINKDAIITIMESCSGDLNLAADAIMKITNESTTQDTENNENASVPGNVDHHKEHPKKNVPSNTNSMKMQGSTSRVQPQSRSSEKHPQKPPSTSQHNGAMLRARTTGLGPSKVPWNDQIRRIVESHNCGSRILIIMRGVPGSGKTHLAQQIVEMLIGGTYTDLKTHICSTDDFFMYRGRYQFNKLDLSQAHAWNQGRVKVALNKGLSPILIDNTNVEIWEMEVYVRMGVENGYIIEVVEPKTPWALKPFQLVKKNMHNVPLATIKRMVDNFVENITGDYLIKYYKLHYPHNRKPPVIRSMPKFQPLQTETTSVSNAAATNIASTSQLPIQASDSTGKNKNINKNSIQVQKMEYEDTPEPEEKIEKIDENAVGNNMEITDVHTQKNTTEKEHDYIATNVYCEVQKQLKEIEKVEIDWDNGEKWEEIKHEDIPSIQNEEGPKPPRNNSPKHQADSDNTLMNEVDDCQDWSKISLFMPPWKDETAKSAETVDIVVETQSSATCMELGDYDLTKTSHKTIVASPRDINEFHIALKEKIPERRMLDQSTTTTEISVSGNVHRCENQEAHFIALRKLFKNVSKTALRDVFDTCMGDVNWAVEIILDGVAANQIEKVDEEEIEEDDSEFNTAKCNCMSILYNISPNSSPEENSNDQSNEPPTEPAAVVLKKNNKREIKSSDASLQLKRQIEQNVVISENHYSKHCLNLKKWRHGEYLTDEEVAQPVQDDAQPSTSQGVTNDNQIVVYRPTKISSDDESSDDESTATMEDLEKTVNINIGREFVNELDAMFGRSDMTYPENLMPRIRIPLTLLNEINALWMESLMHQLDEHERQNTKIIQEDAEYARALSMKEAELAVVGKEPEILDFKEIMDMDYALSIYQRDVRGWKAKEPTDLAAKLTRDKLYNLFPDVAREVLAEVLMAHDNNFQATVEGLLVSTGKADILKEKNGLNNFVTQKEMQRQQKALDEEKKALSKVEWPLLPAGKVPDMAMVNGYRDTADRHLKNRNTNFRKASDYVRRGMLCVSGYYRQLASFHTLMYEQTNSLAAASLMQLHAAKSPDNATIDLHYLRVGEAREALDIFLDTHIAKLRDHGTRSITLYFITGRGLHSNGRPRVKPAIKKRLCERGLVFQEVNPGLLSARVCRNDKLTHQLSLT